ncbi:hypothetical protein Phi17218_097 [Cellulophaga phage phi17:2_18]|uniref:Uncharacterized protein n=2 Tax=Lightbulbvirus Cba172 TaxID=1918525 RepID=R9ZYQ2_9CAUD|nr:hypothetical protein Phi17:2_gp097 [Cellulophaga phage phi17:2]AGO47630.1 hypothetical protein Phi17:2_gp097 [Cellulophaga phage phi17:2]ALO80500.1 hypothetical protein Phi17218_097 [Cellulophaga phage phi17:2_18]
MYMAKKISREAREMYLIFLDAGIFEDENCDYKGMVGDYDKDIDSFALQWGKINKKIKDINIKSEEV